MPRNPPQTQPMRSQPAGVVNQPMQQPSRAGAQVSVTQTCQHVGHPPPPATNPSKASLAHVATAEAAPVLAQMYPSAKCRSNPVQSTAQVNQFNAQPPPVQDLRHVQEGQILNIFKDGR